MLPRTLVNPNTADPAPKIPILRIPRILAFFFVSDIHLRLDRPERGQRLTRLVTRLGADDTLVINGDLCDFWYVSREIRSIDECPGLRSLAEFRARGGDLILTPGNHDWWMEAWYGDCLGVKFQGEVVNLSAHGLRVHVVHGHRLEKRFHWKRSLESRLFLAAFSTAPLPLATRLDRLLEQHSEKTRLRRHRQLREVFRKYARARLPTADIFVFGHAHERVDEEIEGARMVVLGDWEECVSYLKIDDAGASFVRED